MISSQHQFSSQSTRQLNNPAIVLFLTSASSHLKEASIQSYRPFNETVSRLKKRNFAAGGEESNSSNSKQPMFNFLLLLEPYHCFRITAET